MPTVSFSSAITIAKQHLDSIQPVISVTLSIHTSDGLVLYATTGLPYLEDIPTVAFPRIIATGPGSPQAGAAEPGLSTRRMAPKGYIGLLSSRLLASLGPDENQPFAWNQALRLDISLWSPLRSVNYEGLARPALRLEIEALDDDQQVISQVGIGCQENPSAISGFGTSLFNPRFGAGYSLTLYR